jgi:hypothetical protein
MPQANAIKFNPHTTQPAIACGVLGQILLVIGFCKEKLGGIRNLGRDRD